MIVPTKVQPQRYKVYHLTPQELLYGTIDCSVFGIFLKTELVLQMP